MGTIRGKELEEWKLNAEEDYIKTPISVLKYITVLEEENKRLHKPVVMQAEGSDDCTCMAFHRSDECYKLGCKVERNRAHGATVGERSVGTNVVGWECLDCGKRFKRQEDLYYHYDTKHS